MSTLDENYKKVNNHIQFVKKNMRYTKLEVEQMIKNGKCVTDHEIVPGHFLSIFWAEDIESEKNTVIWITK